MDHYLTPHRLAEALSAGAVAIELIDTCAACGAAVGAWCREPDNSVRSTTHPGRQQGVAAARALTVALRTIAESLTDGEGT